MEKEFNFQEKYRENNKFIIQKEIDPIEIEKQFVKTNTRFYLTVGEINCPTGKIIVSDPLCYLPSGKFSSVLEKNIPIGTYKVEISICRNEYIGIRMATARLKIKDTKAVKYILATIEKENAIKNKDGELNGFFVDAGMMSFCDVQVAEEYRIFLDQWYKNNENKNHYDDYFSNFFKESYENYPAYQREDGDFIEWTNPNTKNKMVMIASGLGDGFYQSYWGYDENDEICDLIVPMLNPSLFE